MNTQVALIVDAALTLGFGVQHSTLAMITTKAQVKKFLNMTPLAWRSVESLVNVLYILVAAALWQRVDVVIWDIQGFLGHAMLAACCASWLWYWELHLVEYDCGLAFGSTTLVSRIAGQAPPKLVGWKVGSRRWIRFPVHTAFFGMFLLLPHMTADGLVLGVVLNVYNVIGSVLYDRRLEKLIPVEYAEYQRFTGLIWPPIYRAPLGAKSVPMPDPTHWRKPSMRFPGLIGGGLLTVLYFVMLGNPDLGVVASIKAGAVGILGALLVGLLLGNICKPEASDWAQQQTDLSTTVALAAASAIVFWVIIVWARDGTAPNFAYYLPLWFTVQYLGHVFAVLANMPRWAMAPAMPAGFAAKDAPQSSS